MAERRLRRLAAGQHGVVTRSQLLEAGLRSGAIDWRMQAGRLRPLHRGVYLVGPVAPPLAREMAAVLAAGPRAVVSHRTAASLWQLVPSLPDGRVVDVIVVGRNPSPRRGVRVHRVRSMGRDEVRTFKHVPITTPARTILDLAAEIPPRELEQAVAEAERRKLAEARHLLALVARYPRRHGTRALNRMLKGGGEPALTRSEAEERFLALVRRAELPEPEANARLAGYEVDFLWRAARLVVEVDGFAYHSDRAAFERDRRRDAELAAGGHRVIRVTWRQIVDEPIAVAARIAQALASPGTNLMS
ncbi:MAG TPA: DUF559 domain-containing protein [Solirubrobacterales bacterium]|nr:DUF559 domain-containing protein [Solirubrobacterales bacterium]